MFSQLKSAWHSLRHRSKFETDLDDEMRGHIESRADDLLRSGAASSREDAIRRARLEFGCLEAHQDRVRESRRIHWFEQAFQDFRFCIRLLRKTPAVTAIALLSLALGIGANTAIFSLIDAVMLRMLPVQNPEQLTRIVFRSPASPRPRSSVTNPIWEQVRDHQDAFSGVIAWSPKTFDLANGGKVNYINGIYASGDYFSVLGVRPAVGRLMSASDDVRGCSGVAVLGHGFWQSHYAGAENAVGSLIRLNGHAFPIIGVAQRGFFGTDVGEELDVAIPVCAEAILAGKESALDLRSDWWLLMMGRLKPPLTLEQADARMKVLSPPLFGAVVPQDWEPKYQAVFRNYAFVILPGATGTSGFYGLRAQYRQPLEILMFVVGLVLLIACANIASLLLARSAARQKEIGVRLSLGASRGRLIRQLLTESVVLSGVGALLGVLFARWGSALLVRLVSTQQNEVFLDLKMDGRVLGFTVAVAVLCGVLFGILPAFRSTRIDAISAIKEGQLQAPSGRSQSASARWIVAAQFALSLILVIGAGLFIRTFTNLMTLNAGFDASNVLMVETNVHSAGIPERARAALYGQMLSKLRALPGVVSAGQCWVEPLSGHQWDNSLTAPGHPLPDGVDSDTLMNWVTQGYFETMRTPLLEGRMFDMRDSATSTPVVIINNLMARRYFGTQSPIGEHLVGGSEGMLGQPLEIVGVVQDSKYASLSDDFQSEAYFPLSQILKNVDENTAFEIRTAMAPGALIPAVRDTLASVNNLASLQFTTLKQQADDSVLQQHLMAVLSGFFGALALLLTAIGLYGVMSYVVTLRTHEIGIRMALGARQTSVLSLIMRDAAIVVAAGTAAGLLSSFWVTRLTRSLLFGLTPRDPSTLAFAIIALVAVAFFACYIPACRAMRVDPMVALRHE